MIARRAALEHRSQWGHESAIEAPAAATRAILRLGSRRCELQERPSLVAHHDERGRNWLHICCATALKGRDARPSIRTADVLLARGIDLNDHAFTQGRWRATPVWFCVAFGRNLRLAEHLLKLGASPHYSLYTAAYNRDTAAIRLLVRYGADIEESSGRGETPLLGAVGWSHFEAAEAMLECGANVNAQNVSWYDGCAPDAEEELGL